MQYFLPKLKTHLAKTAWRLLLGPVAGKMPSNFVFSIEEKQHDPQVANHLVEKTPIFPQITTNWSIPEHYPPWFRRQFVFPQLDAFLMRDVVLGPTSGAVWTKSGSVFGESIGSLNKALTFGKVLPDLCNKPARVNPTDYDDQDVFLPAPPVSYFHWLCEVLPNLIQLVSLYPQARLVTALERPRYVDESLRLIFGDNFLSERIVTAQRPLCVPIAAFATMPTASGFVRSEHALALRKAVLDKLSKTEASTTEGKIFVSRRGAKARAISDQDSLEQTFERNGYKIVQLQTMPWLEQVKLFANAGSVAGLHGAGFSNIIFSPHNCSIYEIFPESYFNDCYARLAEGWGMAYKYSLANVDRAYLSQQ